MTPDAITTALTTAQALFLPIVGQPTNDNLVRLVNAVTPVVLKATYDRANGIHNLWGLVAKTDRYLHHYEVPFLRPGARPACYDPDIADDATCVKRICVETSWAAQIQDYEAYEAAK
jgi:hypothetical protein